MDVVLNSDELMLGKTVRTVDFNRRYTGGVRNRYRLLAHTNKGVYDLGARDYKTRAYTSYAPTINSCKMIHGDRVLRFQYAPVGVPLDMSELDDV